MAVDGPTQPDLMNNTLKSPTIESSPNHASERSTAVTVAGWTAGVTACVALGALASSPTWPMAIGVVAVTAMVAVVCCVILTKAR